MKLKSTHFLSWGTCQLALMSFLMLQVNQLLAQSTKNDSLVYKSLNSGNAGISHYAGQSNFSLPLLNIQTRDISIPISLSYNSSGFRPNLPSGMVGLNWALGAQGYITRKVNTEPDDRDGDCSTHSQGFYAGTKTTSTNIDNQVFNFTAPMGSGCSEYPGYEHAPDEFSFNVLGHSGKFYITNDGLVKVVSDENIVVNLGPTTFAVQSYGNQVPVYSTISMYTPDGYTFYFGGSLNTLDYTFTMPDENSIESSHIINTWHLRWVITPNGYSINYIYKPFTSTITSTSLGSGYDNFYTLSSYMNSESHSWNSTYPGGPYINNPVVNKDVYRLQKVCYLDRIESNDFRVNFNYSPNTYKFLSNSAHTPYASAFNTFGLKLDNITLYNAANEEIKRFDFGYQQLGGTYGSRNFLTGLSESGVGNYSFNYFRTTEIPGVKVRNIDHWGFWKGGYDESTILVPSVSQDGSGDQIISSTLRDPVGSYCNVGMLQSVTYPTGGKTSFVYEPHDYSKRLERRASSSFLPALFNVAGITGGARIKSITDSASLNNIVTKSYNYKTNYVNGGTSSSGLLLDWPRYIWDVEYSKGYFIGEYRRRGSSFQTNYNNDEPFVNYAEVTEEVAGNGYRVMKFSNYDSNPDYLEYNTRLSSQYPTGINLPDLYRNFTGIMPNDRMQERGKLKSDEYYNNNATLISSVATTYTPFNPSTPNYIVGTRNGALLLQSYKTYTTTCRPLSVTGSSFAPGTATVAEVKSFTYDSMLKNLKTESLVKSNGKTLVRILNYGKDYGSGSNFTNQLRIGTMPVEDVTYETDGTNVKILSGKLIQYYNVPNEVRPEVIYQLEAAAPVPLASFKFSNRSTGVLPTSGTATAFAMDARYKPALNFTQYDSFGNVTEVIPQQITKGIASTFKYGYNGQFKIADVINARMNEVYTQNFEENQPDYEPNLLRVSTKIHTGKFAGFLPNSSASETYCHSNQVLTLSPGTKRSYTYSGWIYSTGPSAELFLFMYRAGETGYYSYVDQVQTSVTNKWVYLSKTFQVPDDVISVRMRVDNNSTGDVWFDDLAIRPAASQLSTYTYQPFVGKTSTIDGTGKTTYYEYDQYRRPINRLDENGNIVESKIYHVKP